MFVNFAKFDKVNFIPVLGVDSDHFAIPNAEPGSF